MKKTTVSHSRKRVLSVRGTSISAKEIKACFAQLAQSPESSRDFLEKIGVTSSAELVIAK